MLKAVRCVVEAQGALESWLRRRGNEKGSPSRVGRAALFAAWPTSARAETAAPEIQSPAHLVTAYETNYILPAYYTFSPDNAVYGTTLPNGQSLKKIEAKFQLSFKVALASSGPVKSVYVAYTQMSYWQLYGHSAFFRETNYQPELLIAPRNRWGLGAGWSFGLRLSPFVHQSNGRGGDLERSWDRSSADLLFERLDGNGDGWTADLRAWVVWHDPAYQRYNPDLARYLGYFRPSAAYKRGPWEISLTLRNQFESVSHPGQPPLSAWSAPKKSNAKSGSSAPR